MTIKELCYELYKTDWMQRISADRQMDAWKNYYQDWDGRDNEACNFHDDYLSQNGYDGELYVSYDEFLESEYTDEEYIRQLLDNEELFEEYKNSRPSAVLLEAYEHAGNSIETLTHDILPRLSSFQADDFTIIADVTHTSVVLVWNWKTRGLSKMQKFPESDDICEQIDIYLFKNLVTALVNL